MWEDFKYWLKNHDYQWKYKLKVCLPLFVFLVACDWASKIAIQLACTQGEQHTIIDGFINFNYIINPGSAYGANAGNVGLSIAIASIITLITAVIIVFLNDRMWLIAIVFIFAGSFANLIARSWSPAVASRLLDGTIPDHAGQKGGVIDFLNWGFGFAGQNGYIFNIADAWVCIGVALLVIFVIVELIKFWVQTSKANKLLLSDNENDTDDTFSTNQPRIDAVRKQSVEPRTYTDKELKAQAKLEKKMRKHEHKSK